MCSGSCFVFGVGWSMENRIETEMDGWYAVFVAEQIVKDRAVWLSDLGVESPPVYRRLPLPNPVLGIVDVIMSVWWGFVGWWHSQFGFCEDIDDVFEEERNVW